MRPEDFNKLQAAMCRPYPDGTLLLVDGQVCVLRDGLLEPWGVTLYPPANDNSTGEVD